MDKAIKKIQSEHESLNKDSLQSKHESEIVSCVNCNLLMQSKHESKLTRENPQPNCNHDRERLTKYCFELLSELFNSKHYV